jgi:hypothetical protein
MKLSWRKRDQGDREPDTMTRKEKRAARKLKRARPRRPAPWVPRPF